MATFTVRPEGIIRQPALTMPGNATGSEAACTALTASQIRLLCSVYSTSEVDSIAATKVSAASLALGTSGSDLNWSGTTLNVPDAGASARGVVTTGSQTLAGQKTFSSNILVTNSNVNSCEYRVTNSSSGVSAYFAAGGTTGFGDSRYANATYLEANGGPLHLSANGGNFVLYAKGADRFNVNYTSGESTFTKTINTTGIAQYANHIRMRSAAGVGDWAFRVRELAENDFALYNVAGGAYGFIVGSDSSFKAYGPIYCGVYTFATVPTASSYAGAAIRISDRSQKWAYSDGTDWRFFVDGAVIS